MICMVGKHVMAMVCMVSKHVVKAMVFMVSKMHVFKAMVYWWQVKTHISGQYWFATCWQGNGLNGNYLHGGLGLAAGAWGYVAATSVQSYAHIRFAIWFTFIH